VFVAFQHTSHCPKHILSAANKAWFHANGTARFGASHHTNSPQQWATQALALNISVHLMRHLSKAITKEMDNNTTAKMSKISQNFLGKPFYPPTAQPLLPGKPKKHSRSNPLQQFKKNWQNNRQLQPPIPRLQVTYLHQVLPIAVHPTRVSRSRSVSTRSRRSQRQSHPIKNQQKQNPHLALQQHRLYQPLPA
jgi:hypothetical protein